MNIFLSRLMMACLIISLLYITTLMTIVASINCQGLRSADRRQTAFSFFTRSRFDIIFLQETHWTADMEIELQRDWQGHVSCTHGTNSARDVAILISSRLDYKVKETKRDNEGRVLNLVIEMDEQTINLVNVYAPNTDTERRNFLEFRALYFKGIRKHNRG